MKGLAMNLKKLNRKQTVAFTIITAILGYLVGSAWRATLIQRANAQYRHLATLEKYRMLNDTTVSPEEFQQFLDHLDQM